MMRDGAGREVGSMGEPSFFLPVVTQGLVKRVVLFGSHRSPWIPRDFYQWREEGNMGALWIYI